MAVKVTVKDSIKNESEKKASSNKVDEKIETKTGCCCNKNKDVLVYVDGTGLIHVNKEYAKEFPEITLELVKSECRKSEMRNEYYVNKLKNNNCCYDKDEYYTEDCDSENYSTNGSSNSKILKKVIDYLNSIGFKVELEEITNF